MSRVKAVVERLSSSGIPVQRRDETVLSARVTRNGARTVNDGTLTFSLKTAIGQNDNVKYIQDVADTSYLSGIWNFQGSGKDESGYDLHATDSSGDDPVISRFLRPNVPGNEARFSGQYALAFNANGQALSVPNTREYYDRVDLSGQFDVYVWCQYNNTDDFRNLQPGDTGIIFSNADPGTAGFDIGFRIDPTGVPVTFARFFYTTGLPVEHVGERLFFNRIPTLIRITRDENNMVSVYNNGAFEFGFTDDRNMDSGVGLTFGDRQHPSSSEPWTGQLFQARVYSGTSLRYEDAESIRLSYPQPITMKIDGKVWRINDDTNTVTCDVQDNDRILVGANMTRTSLQGSNAIRTGNVYNAGVSTFSIVEDMVDGIDPEYLVKLSGTSPSMFHGKFVATQALIQCVDLVLLENQRVLNYMPNKIILMEPASGYATPYVFSEGVPGKQGVLILNTGDDNITKANDIELIGRVRIKHSVTMANITADGQSVVLTKFPLDLRVTRDSDGAVIVEDGNPGYTVDYEAKTITFRFSSQHTVGPVTIEFNYEDLESDTSTKLYCRHQNSSDIDASERYSIRMFVPQLTHREDIDQAAMRFVARLRAVNRRYEISVPWHANNVLENRNVGVKNPFKGIDVTVPVRSVTWNYPQMTTVIESGEYLFDSLEYEKQNVAGITSTLASTIKTQSSD